MTCRCSKQEDYSFPNRAATAGRKERVGGGGEIAETEVIHHFIHKHLLKGHREPREPEKPQQNISCGQLYSGTDKS